RYQETATYTSPVLDLSANGAWGTTPVAFSDTADSESIGTVNYYTRSSADNTDWSSWEAVTTPSGASSNIASDPRRYFQWKAVLDSSASSQTQTPSITNMTLSYVEDSTAPSDPSTASGYSTSSTETSDLTSGSWYNYSTPKFTWPAGVDQEASGQSASGIDGYHVLLTTTNPSETSVDPSSHTGDDCYAWVADDEEDGGEYIVGTSNTNCSLSDNTYYLVIQTKDHSGNTSSASHVFTYKYDGTVPSAPTAVSSTQVGYSATNSFDFYWPAATDTGGSGIAYYQYKTGSTDATDPFSDWQSTTSASDRQVSSVTAYTEGQNFFYVRTVDNAGNVSATSSSLAASPFYFNESAPTAPTNLTITPTTTQDDPATSNVFTVSWDEPESYSGDIEKYYYCVNCTPSATTMTETTATETVNKTITSAALANQQGKNTLYLVAEDNNINSDTGHGNRNFDAYASVDFYASTTAPTAPSNLSISDSSDRSNTIWRLTLAWNEAATSDSVDHYNVYRSTDGNTYTNIGNVSSEAYTDTNLTYNSTYYYKVTAIDNAGSESIASNIVSAAPVGKYTDPPSAGGVPSASVGSTTATITWSTSRDAYGTVEYGKTTSYGSSGAETSATSSHSVKLTGLAPGTTYHYRVHSLDDSSLVGYDRSEAYSADYTFTTLNTANISNVTIDDIGLDSAVISWDTASLSSSQVDYGTTTEYGEVVEVSTTADESTHTARLTNLSHSTEYHFRIQGVTADSTDIASEDYTFSTITFPEITATLLNTDQAASGATVVLAWATNVATTGTVEYQPVEVDIEALDNSGAFPDLLVNTDGGRQVNLDELQNLSTQQLSTLPIIPQGSTSSLYQGELADKHVQRITGLEDGSIYTFTIRGKDQYGNEVVGDPIRYVTGADTRAPRILNQIIETPIKGAGTEAKSQIIISFETDEPAHSQVLWGQGSGTEYPQATEKSTEPTTKHVIVLRDLEPTTTYHLKITAQDPSGNKSETQDSIVVTPTAQQAAFDIVLKNLEDVFGFLDWR
ncbi:MAG: hypothetical protein GF381_00415, partial [Candidatus Pacebacteria bacterium]|nr:hypothetical protein [Candidatus Paceibacterota bacterium]